MTTRHSDKIKIGLLLPQDGPIGMWNLSSENCAQMAIAELNSAGGILGREISYDVIDASGSPSLVAAKTMDLVRENDIEAIVGMHTSDIRVAVTKQLNSEIPYIFTPMYEGGEQTPGVYLVGQTAMEQVSPMILWMRKNLGVKSWYFIGNDYNYSYMSCQTAKQCIQDSEGRVVGERHVPFNQNNFRDEIKTIERLMPDAVYVNLVGDSSVMFNRAFGRAGLHEKTFRYCGALEENTVLSIGAKNAKGMYTSTGYFENLLTDDASNFSKLYRSYYGKTSPVLNQFAVSCYEGLMLLSAMAECSGSVDVSSFEAVDRGKLSLFGPRGELRMQGNHVQSSSYIVEAKGLELNQV